jgi:hypothetical protein
MTHALIQLACAAALLVGADRAAAQEAPADGPPPERPTDVGWLSPDALVLRSTDGSSSIRPVGLLQVQLAHEWRDGAPDDDRLFVERARLGVAGSILTRDLRYLVLADLGGKGPRLTFLTVDLPVVPDWLIIRAGQFKRPFSRAFLTGAGHLALIDRPLTVGPDVFGDDADVGVMLHDGATGPLEYAVGVFGGSGPGLSSNPIHPLLAARVAASMDGLDPYVESDVRGGAPRFGATAAALVDLDADGDGASFASVLVDLMLKAHGLTVTSALTVGWRQTGPRWQDQAFWALGHSTQVSQVVTDWLEPVARYAFLMPADGADRHEVSAGLNVHLFGRALTWRNDVSLSLHTADGREVHDVRVQSQLDLSLP